MKNQYFPVAFLWFSSDLEDFPTTSMAHPRLIMVGESWEISEMGTAGHLRYLSDVSVNNCNNVWVDQGSTLWEAFT